VHSTQGIAAHPPARRPARTGEGRRVLRTSARPGGRPRGPPLRDHAPRTVCVHSTRSTAAHLTRPPIRRRPGPTRDRGPVTAATRHVGRLRAPRREAIRVAIREAR
jgi:hypothetical protein